MSEPHVPPPEPQYPPANQLVHAPQPYGMPGYGPLPMPINNNLGWAIGSLFVCWPFGIPSLIKSLQVQSLWAQGQFQQAERSAAEAKKWGRIGVIAAAGLLGLYVAGLIVYLVVVFVVIGAVGISGL